MILVRKRMVIMVILLAGTFILFLGIRGYLLIKDFSFLTKEEVKFNSENILYISIIGTAAILVLLLVILLKSRNVSRELDKIIELTRVGNFSPAESLKKIGKLGEKIRLLYFQLSELNARKSLKISSMSGINTFLLNNIDLPVVITDVTGKIGEVSRRYLKKYKAEKIDIIGKNIADVVSEIDFQDIVAGMEREHTLIEVDEVKEQVSFYPVFNRNNELSNIVCIRGKESIYSDIARKTEEKTGTFSKVTGFMKKYFASKQNQ